MLNTHEISEFFLNERNKKRIQINKTKTKLSESEKVINKTNGSYKNLTQTNTKYSNNLTEQNFKIIVDKQLVYELDDYKTNYSYTKTNNVDPNLTFDLNLQDDLLNFITDKFYGKNEQYKFMRLIDETFNIAIKVFTQKFNIDSDDIKLIFYNDVILRKIAEKFIYTLPNKSAINLSEYFDKYFNSVSLEWYIILNPTLEKYDTIYNKLKFYVALIMKQLNTYIIVNKHNIFQYFKYNNTYKDYIKLELSSLIETILNNLEEYNRNNKVYEVQNVNITPSVHSYKYNDKNVLLNNNAEEHLFQINIIEEENNINYHQSLELNVSIKSGNFYKNKYKGGNSYMRIPISLMTIKLGHKTDTFVSNLIRSEKNERTYTYMFSLEDVFMFNGLSFKFICENLEENAYDEEPWSVQNWKYIYGRLVFFYLIDLFVNVRSNRIRNSVVTLSKKYIVLLKDVNKEFSKGDEKEMERIYEMLLRKYADKLNIKLIKLIQNIHSYNLKYKYNVKFKEFIEFIDQLLYVIENLFRGVYSYCTQSNDVFEENLYKGNVKYII